jgi:urea-proton symporter
MLTQSPKMRSKNGLIFGEAMRIPLRRHFSGPNDVGVINIVGNFATVFGDQAYWQRAIASRPSSTVQAYILGGLAWFAIPFSFATTLGLAAVALKGHPEMKELTPSDVAKGLPAAAAATLVV